MTDPFIRLAARLLAAARTRAAARMAQSAADRTARWRSPVWLWPDLFKD